MPLWSFWDYINDRGENVIKTWLDRVGAHARKKVRATLNARLDYGAAWDLTYPQFRTLHGECAGLLEIRFQYRNVQYRPLACRGPLTDQVTLLMGATERDGDFDPPDACRTALVRAARIHEEGRVQPHEY